MQTFSRLLNVLSGEKEMLSFDEAYGPLWTPSKQKLFDTIANASFNGPKDPKTFATLRVLSSHLNSNYHGASPEIIVAQMAKEHPNLYADWQALVNEAVAIVEKL